MPEYSKVGLNFELGKYVFLRFLTQFKTNTINVLEVRMLFENGIVLVLDKIFVLVTPLWHWFVRSPAMNDHKTPLVSPRAYRVSSVQRVNGCDGQQRDRRREVIVPHQ